jgi:hypothetical protein
MADDRGASEGERNNARSLLAKLGPEPNPMPRPPDFSGPLYRHRPAPPPEDNYTRWDDFYFTGRQPPRRPPAGYPDYSSRTMDELLRMMRAAMYDFDDTLKERMRKADIDMDGAGTAQPIDCAGKHDYVVIGTSMFHTDIRRCLRCGVYDPPRRSDNGPRKQGAG